MVMQEMSPPRETHLLLRGQYDKPGEVVTPKIPSALITTTKTYPANRLGLAQWLVDPANPLMSRVTVNRFWQQYFGIGIVKSAEISGPRAKPRRIRTARLARHRIHPYGLERQGAPEDHRHEARTVKRRTAATICSNAILRIVCCRTAERPPRLKWFGTKRWLWGC
jgi:hypothetical protein